MNPEVEPVTVEAPQETRSLVELVGTGDARLVKRALEAGADVNAQDHNDMTALHHAAALGARPCLRLLVASGRCDYLIQDRRGRYASDLAIEHGRDFAVARLLGRKQVLQALAQGVPPYVRRNAPEAEAD